MSYRRKSMVVIDMDGTLLTDEKTISNYSKGFLHYINQRGIRVVLASGRPYRAVKPYYDEIGLKDLIVCYNGALIVDPQENDKILFKKSFPISLVKDIIAGIGEENFESIMIEDFDTLYINKKDSELDKIAFKKGMVIKYGDIFSQLNEEPLCVTFNLKDFTYYNKLLELGSTSKFKDINIRFWHDCLIAELFFNDVNKYTSIEKVAKLYEVKNSDIICFGDADNDIEMIHRAGIGVGMCNAASKFVRQSANMLSLADNNNDGVVKTLELLLSNYDLKN